MRTLTATELSNQKGRVVKPLIKIVLTHNSTSYTYTSSRILKLKRSEKHWSQSAEVVLDDADKVLHGLDLEGFKGVISRGFTTSEGDEYSATAPLWVVGQQRDSYKGKLLCSLSLVGTLDLMAQDKALSRYTQDDDDSNTVKDLLDAIAGATLAPFSHCSAVTITYDSEDALLDAFVPADYFTVAVGDTRLAKMKELLRYTACQIRVEDDEEIHVFVPVVSVTPTVTLRPNAAGDETNLTPGTGNNYEQVDEEVADEASTYVYNNKVSSYQRDLYNIPTSAIGTGTITKITLYFRVMNWGIDGNTVKGVIKSNSTVTETAEKNPYSDFGNSVWGTYSQDWTTNPADSQPWEWSDIADLQIGVSLKADATHLTYCTQVYVEVVVPLDYEYRLEDTYHTFFSKRFRRRIVFPNKVTVANDDYSGSATDASYSLIPKEEKKYMRVTSDAQCASLAAAILSNFQLDAEKGAAVIPFMNIGQEEYDYVLITDTRAGDTRAGNIGWFTEYYEKNKFSMSFGFGRASTLPLSDFAGLISSAGLSVANLLPLIEQSYDYIEQILSILEERAERISFRWLDPENTIDLTKIGDTLDNLEDGSTYARVKSASLSAAGLVLLDEVVEGTYELVLATQISAGKIVLSSGVMVSEDYVKTSAGTSRVELTSTGLKGYNNSVLQVEIKATDGKIYAGAGAVVIDASGITMSRSDSGDNLDLVFKYGANIEGWMYPVSGGVVILTNTGDDLFIGVGSGGGIAIAGGALPASVADSALDLYAVGDVRLWAPSGKGLSVRAGGTPVTPTADDISITAADEIILEADDRLGIGSGSLLPGPAANDIVITGGDDVRIFSNTSGEIDLDSAGLIDLDATTFMILPRRTSAPTPVEGAMYIRSDLYLVYIYLNGGWTIVHDMS